MKLLFFGTTKKYLIFAWLANLPAAIRNNNSEIGGNRLMGWFLVVG